MTDILLAKPKLQPGWIDCSIGEAYVVRETLMKTFNLSSFSMPLVDPHLDYPSPVGYGPLVSLLEEKHGHPVVITNGAKQALAAILYTIKKLGKQSVGMLNPFWTLIPPLVDSFGLTSVLGKHPFCSDAYLALAPNNPDSFTPDLDCLQASCKSRNIPLVHDAAYYTHTYLPATMRLQTFGDSQIFSISKSFGLSSLRLGYVVCPNPDFYTHVQEYMEMMTVGVSIMPQVFLMDLLFEMKQSPDRTQEFLQQSHQALKIAKRTALTIDPSILNIRADLEDVPGMFLWTECKDYAAFQRAKINVIQGEHFGVPDYIRMNLAFNEQRMKEIVERLNNAKANP